MLAWIDLEMTGLDPQRHVILEIATLVTDDELRLVAEGPHLVVHQPPEALSRMDDHVRRMHTDSGLLGEVESSAVSLADAGGATLAFLRESIAEPGTAPLCGNSVGMDRRFLARYLPEIENFLHYRSVDVSSVKELARRWQPEVLANAPEKAKNHQALDDIRESLEELRWYRRSGFIGGSGLQGRSRIGRTGVVGSGIVGSGDGRSGVGGSGVVGSGDGRSGVVGSGVVGSGGGGSRVAGSGDGGPR